MHAKEYLPALCQETVVAGPGGGAGDDFRRRNQTGELPIVSGTLRVPHVIGTPPASGHPVPDTLLYVPVPMPSLSSSSSWMMIRGVTIIIRLEVSRPMPTFLNKRLR